MTSTHDQDHKPMTEEEIADAHDLAARIVADGTWSVSESFQSVIRDARHSVVAVADGDLFNGRDFERDAEDIVAAHNALPRLLAEIDRLRTEVERLTREDSRAAAAVEIYMERAAVATDDVGPTEEPMPAVAIAGERCECCGRAFVEGEQVASFAEDDVVMCYGRCPEPDPWYVENNYDGETRREWYRDREAAWTRALELRGYRWPTRVRLVRARTVRP